MQKNIIKGYLHILEPEPTKTNNGQQLQKLVVLEPGYTDSFGDKKGQDQYFEILFFNEKIKSITPGLYEKVKVGAPIKVEITCFLNGSMKKTDDKTYYNTFLAGTEIKILD
jgi:type VI protein secretion system component Hcp